MIIFVLVVTPAHLASRETLNSLSSITMSNTGSHLMSTLNPNHLSDNTGSYFVSGLSDLASNYKLNPSSNTDLPSPSSSSNSSNPPSSSQHHHLHSHLHHPTRRHGEGNDPTRKREMRLQKNREAARECRRKKKEYIKCLEERVAVLENQNKALIEELRQLKELYCQREETNNKNNSKTTTTSTVLCLYVLLVFLFAYFRHDQRRKLRNIMNLTVPLSPTSSGFHRSHSDRDLLAVERRLTRARLNSSSSSSNLASLSTTSTSNTTSSPSHSGSLSASVFLPWDRLHKWFYGIAIVTFDLELGQSIELLLPSHCKLTDKEKLNLSYLSFPDTNSTSLGDFQYHFRMNHESSNLTVDHQYYNSIVPPALQIDHNSLFGYVNFRQIRDKNIPRGFFQKSFVILSKLPFISLFLKIVHRLAINYFEHGLTSLESCCHLMDCQWPEPEPGKTLLLPLLDNVLQVRIPTHGDKPFSSSDLVQFRSIVHETMNNQNHSHSFKFPIDDDIDIDTPSKDSSGHNESKNSNKPVEYVKQNEQQQQQLPYLIPLVYDVNTYQSLLCVLNHIQLLWELVLLNEPIAIVGNFPTKCSQTVQALVHIIWPLRYANNYRPFFTIHNSEFHEITFNSSLKSSFSPPQFIIGVTNPFFAKLIHQWPHIIRVDDDQQGKPIKKRENFLLVEHDEDNLSVNELEDSIELSSSPQAPIKVKKKISTNIKPYKPTSTLNDKSSHLTFVKKAGLYTKYRSYLQRDKVILRKLQSTNSNQRPDTVQNTLLRRFFLELTQSFIIPLERYFASLLPLRKYYQANREPPTIKEFDNEEFLKTLDQYGPQLTSGLKGDWKELYKHFLSTPNFRLWLSHRRLEANAKIYSLYIEKIAYCRLEQDLNISQLTEIELIDLVIKFKDLIQRIETKHDELLIRIDQKLKCDYLEKLKIKMKIIIDENLSEDMKILFNKPSRLSSS
ncbi:unnamed protein product [Rotaria socialis]